MAIPNGPVLSSPDPFSIEEWGEDHPRWQEGVAYLEREQVAHALLEDGRVVPDGHLLVAVREDTLVGILIFVVQPIGPEMDCLILCDPSNVALTELKIRAFHVREEHRGQGIGTALQREALRQAGKHGCYQVRSRSDFSRAANYAIKLKLGFAAHPGLRRLRDRDEPGIYWVKAVSCSE